MKSSTLHTYFNIEMDKSIQGSYPSFLPEEIDYWLNSACMAIIKTRYSGLNIHSSSFQQTQKRSDDLRFLVSERDYDVMIFSKTEDYYVGDMVYYEERYYQCTEDAPKGDFLDSKFTNINSFGNGPSFDYPINYMIALGERVLIRQTATAAIEADGLPALRPADITEATIENIDRKLSNVFSEHRMLYGKANPLRVFSNNKIQLFTDESYSIARYSLIYLKMPNEISIDDDSDIEIFPEYMWSEVVVFAAKMALKNTADARLNAYSVESQSIE